MGSMKRCTKFFVLSGVLGLASLVGMGSVHAQLKFQTTQPVEFTFNPTLSLNVSGDLVVNNLTAGSNADSNEITVAVNTNVMNGYYLAATAGTSSTNTNLVNTSNSDYIFTSLATNADLDSMSNADGNTWGYAFKVGSGSYGNYSGLPLDDDDSGETGAILVNTTTAADSKLVTFKIGAKASNNQPAGVYTNTINFYAVSYPLPEDKTIDDLQYMQDFAALTSEEKVTVLNSMTTDQQYTLTDNRDSKEYYIAKLRDGNVWMTQNLDHNIVTTTDFYTPANTDVPTNWTASTATYDTGTTTWAGSNIAPESYDPGNYCWSGVLDDRNLADCGTSLGEPNHYHLGNYYNWAAAIAVNDSSGYGADGKRKADQSICPAGWTLPTAGPVTRSGSYKNLLTGYGLSGFEMTNPHIWEDPLYFPFSGGWDGDLRHFVGVYGYYWSSVVDMYDSSSYDVFILNFVSSNGDLLATDFLVFRGYGSSVRCVAR